MKCYQPERANQTGKHVAYFNWATALAGLIVATVSGLDFHSYVQAHIFNVLGLQCSPFVESLPAGVAERFHRHQALL
ncbi:MAG: hypothetical protein RLN85_13330 [Pseudomonadales bacterium]